MPIYQRGNSWQVSVGSGPDRYRDTAPSHAEALILERQEIIKRKQISLGIYVDAVAPKVAPSVTMQKALEKAKKTVWRVKGASQARNAERVLVALGDTVDIKDVTRDRISELVEDWYEEGNSGSTINRKLSALNVMLTIAEKESWIERAPYVERQPESKHRVCYYDNAQEAAMLAGCKHLGIPELAHYIVVGIDTGFRRMENLRLSLRDCADGQARLHAGTTKSGVARSVPLTTRCKKIVDERRERGYAMLWEDMTEAQLRKRWDMLRSHLNEEENPNFIIHVLRHTCASRFAIAGKNATFIQTWMGHSSIMVTQRYMYLGPNGLSQGVDALDDYRQNFS